MSFVLDASVTLAWCFSDEVTSQTITLLKRLETETAYEPNLWVLEIGNSLLAAKKRKRISEASIMQFLALLDDLAIKIDDETTHRGFHEILALANAQNLTTYDAAYLELAMRYAMPLATKDTLLKEAAVRVGVEIIQL